MVLRLIWKRGFDEDSPGGFVSFHLRLLLPTSLDYAGTHLELESKFRACLVYRPIWAWL